MFKHIYRPTRSVIRTMSGKPMIVSSRFNNKLGFPVSFKEIIEADFEVIEIDQYLKNPARYRDHVSAVITYEDMDYFGCPIENNKIFDSMPNLKCVSTVSAGYDHLDIPHLRSKGIRVGHTPKQVADATADQAMALMLAGARNLYQGVNAMLGPTEISRDVNCFGQHFTGSTLGIIGMGNIGFQIAKRAHHGFNCKILYHNRNQSDNATVVDAIYYKDLNSMIPNCDFICVVCNLTDQTRNIIDSKQFSLMKKTAVFCNVSRGGTVNQDALFECLRNNKIHCAALDVTEPEPLPRNHPLLQLKNIIIAPHWGTATGKTVNEMTKSALENISKALHDSEMVAEVK